MPASVYSSLADRAARAGGPVYPFHVGDTWMEPAEVARMEALTVARHPGMHRYAPVRGVPALVERLCERVGARTGLAVRPPELLLTGGGTGGLGAVVGATVEPGDEVLLLAPYWPLISGIVRTFGGVPVPVPVLDRGSPSVDELSAAIRAAATDKTVAIYLNTPNNPTGRLLSREAVAAVAAIATERGWWIYADEVYEDLVYDGVHTWTRPFAPERTFSCYSFSKAYGMAGNRLGYVIGPEEPMVDVGKVGLYTVYSAPTASQLAALEVLSEAGDTWIAAARAKYREIGRAAAAALDLPPPEGSTFLFFDLAPHLDARGLGGFLEDCADRGLLLAPGPSFGPFPTSARLCYTAAPPEVTEAGVELLRRVLTA
ncbi:MAG: pyridoxal phosphate-dependent aminotransferase [Myxococcota bacterium]